MVQSPEGVSPGCMSLFQQAGICFDRAQSCKGGGLIGGLRVLPAHACCLIPFLHGAPLCSIACVRSAGLVVYD